MNCLRLGTNVSDPMTYVNGIFLISLFQMFEKNVFIQDAQFSEIVACADWRQLLLFVVQHLASIWKTNEMQQAKKIEREESRDYPVTRRPDRISALTRSCAVSSEHVQHLFRLYDMCAWSRRSLFFFFFFLLFSSVGKQNSSRQKKAKREREEERKINLHH